MGRFSVTCFIWMGEYLVFSSTHHCFSARSEDLWRIDTAPTLMSRKTLDAPFDWLSGPYDRAMSRFRILYGPF